MKTSYFTFGQSHVHKHGNLVIDKNIILRVEDENPREWMFNNFGPEWAFEYDEKEIKLSLRHFPRGIVDAKTLQKVIL